MTKEAWLYKYDACVRKLAKKVPEWQHWPAGHMYHADGLSPEAAARLFLAGTKWKLKK